MASTRDMLYKNRRTAQRIEAEQAPRAGGFQQVCPLPAASEHREGGELREAAPRRIAVPQPIRENSVYRQLMRSHDRVHTRHLKG